MPKKPKVYITKTILVSLEILFIIQNKTPT